MLFKVKLLDKLQLITCPREVDKTAAQLFEVKIEDLASSKAEVNVLDFGETQFLEETCTRVFVQFKQTLKNKGKSLVSIKVPLKVLLQMKKAGVEDVFQPVKNLEEVCKKYGVKLAAAPKIDVGLINPFISSIINYFKQSDKIFLTMKPPKVKQDDTNINQGVVGSINLIGAKFKGAIRVSFESNLAVAIYNTMENKQKSKMDDDVVIFIGNFTQSIFKEATVQLKQNGYDDMLEAFPSLFEVKEGMKMNVNEVEVAIILEFDTNLGSFKVEIISEG